jgi:23S rRNA (adenine2503-C2)-methyltransferase
MQIINTSQVKDITPKENLVGLTRPELEKILIDSGLAKFRARQIWHWIYHKGKTDFSEMTTLSKAVRAELCQNYELSRPHISQEQKK